MHDEHHEKPRTGRGLLGIGLAILLAAGAFFSGLHVGTLSGAVLQSNSMEASVFSWLFPSSSAQPDGEVNLDTFWRVWHLMEEKHASGIGNGVSVEERIDGATRGLVDSYGDPYSVFMPKQESEAFGESISGNFSGVGMEVGVRSGVITVIAPLPGTPAERAGILPGDAVVAIDEKTTERMGVDEAVQLIRGEKGTSVTLTIFREGASEFIDVSIVRDTISIPTSDTEVRDGTFIFSLYNFNALAENQAAAALREFVQSGAERMVLDLRGNPGGYLESATAIASYFLPAGKVIVREDFGNSRPETMYRSQGRVVHSFTPDTLVVLVDGGSASASEILAGALKEHGVATVIGTETFGKGSVQELVSLADGSSLKVTIARWFTPNGHSISEGGLEPDVTIERTVEDRQEDRDPQLEAALSWLQGDRTVGETAAPDME